MISINANIGSDKVTRMDMQDIERGLKKLVNPQSADDFNRFLEKLPQNVGQTALIAAAIAWVGVGALGLYASIEINKLIERRTELAETEAMVPPVPKLSNKPVPKTEVEEFVKVLEDQYSLLTFKNVGGNSVVVTAGTYKAFGQFREAIGHIQNGGEGWRVQLDKLCVGRECDKEELGVTLKINKVKVELPQQKF